MKDAIENHHITIPNYTTLVKEMVEQQEVVNIKHKEEERDNSKEVITTIDLTLDSDDNDGGGG